MHDMIDVLERAFKEDAAGLVETIPRTTVDIKEKEGWIGIMPAYVEGLHSFSTKIVTLYNNNIEKYKLPTIMATIILNDPETGKVLSIMDGSLITAMRTGGIGGVAAKYLSRKDSKTAGIFGAGVQARTQLSALKEVRDISQVLVYDPLEDRARGFAREMGEKLAIPIKVVSSPVEVIKNSDVIATVSTSKVPLFEGKEVKLGTHISAFGTFRPGEREIDTETIVRSRVFVDKKEAALSEAGDLIIPIKEGVFSEAKIAGEIGEVILGSVGGRTSEKEITLFKSVGLGIQDCAAASLAYEKAMRNHVGTEVNMG